MSLRLIIDTIQVRTDELGCLRWTSQLKVQLTWPSNTFLFLGGLEISLALYTPDWSSLQSAEYLPQTLNYVFIKSKIIIGATIFQPNHGGQCQPQIAQLANSDCHPLTCAGMQTYSQFQHRPLWGAIFSWIGILWPSWGPSHSWQMGAWHVLQDCTSSTNLTASLTDSHQQCLFHVKGVGVIHGITQDLPLPLLCCWQSWLEGTHVMKMLPKL